MEVLQGDVGSAKREKKITKISKGEDRLTIMIFKGAGKLRTIRISFRLVLGASLFFLFYIVGTIILSNSYLNIHRVNKNQSEKTFKGC